MINIVMIVKDRPALTRQALDTLVANTEGQWNLTIVDDDSRGPTADLCRMFACARSNVALLRNEKSQGILGQVRNLGAYWSERYFGRGSGHLLFCDNDVAFGREWDKSLLLSSKMCPGVLILGGCRHPYHGVNGVMGWDAGNRKVELTDAVAGYFHMMRWETWVRYGPYDAHARGLGQSEDYALCRAVVDTGGYVGYVDPPVIAHTGITNTDGKPATGHEAFKRVEGILYE